MPQYSRTSNNEVRSASIEAESFGLRAVGRHHVALILLVLVLVQAVMQIRARGEAGAQNEARTRWCEFIRRSAEPRLFDPPPPQSQPGSAQCGLS